MNRARGVLVLACGALLAANAAAQTSAPAAADLVARAGRHARTFIDRFANIIAEEFYVQDVVGTSPMTRSTSQLVSGHRELRSDFLLVRVGPIEWLPFRDVFEVDGKAVRDREERLSRVFLQPFATAIDQATTIVAEDARYNLGAVYRSVINTPVLPLVFLTPDHQAHFTFSLEGRDASLGSNVWMVDLRERRRPTLVRGPSDTNLPASGRYWIDADSGRVLKAELSFTTSEIGARITTTFRRDDRLQTDVPADMREQYILRRGRISTIATYSDFRRVQVNVETSDFRAAP